MATEWRLYQQDFERWNRVKAELSEKYGLQIKTVKMDIVDLMNFQIVY